MLKLSRKVSERIIIGNNIIITITEIHSGRVCIGVEAPKDVKIMRAEVADKDKEDHHG